MNKTSTDKIRSATQFLIWFRRCLPHNIQAQMHPYLDQPYQLALNILDCCSSTQPLGVREIAQLAGVTRETARQVLLALKAGGMDTVSPTRGWQPMEQKTLPPDSLTSFSCDPQLLRAGTPAASE